MRILVSSKHLAAELNKIDLGPYCIIMAEIRSGSDSNTKRLCLYTQFESVNVELNVECKNTPECIEQTGRRWDWVKKLMNQVDEQPIILDITKDKVQVIFDY